MESFNCLSLPLVTYTVEADRPVYCSLCEKRAVNHFLPAKQSLNSIRWRSHAYSQHIKSHIRSLQSTCLLMSYFTMIAYMFQPLINFFYWSPTPNIWIWAATETCFYLDRCKHTNTLLIDNALCFPWAHWHVKRFFFFLFFFLFISRAG